MPKKSKKYNLKSKITSALRRLWFYSPMRREAVKRFKDNGSKCENCNDSIDRPEVDHKIPVVPLTGFDNWQSYIDRLFCESNGLRCWCSSCHSALTMVQKEQRKKYKSKKIVIDKKKK